jgi:glycosyltransferase involved in cell wall biosynthesis
MKIGIVIPAYNAGDQLRNVLSKAQKYISKNRICVIDDGSSDNTSAIARDFGSDVFRHLKNRGKGRALQTGFRWAMQENLDCLITLDADGQHNPDHIPEFISVMEKSGCDIVLGLRQFRVGVMPMDRICSNMLSSFIVSCVAGKRILDSQCGYRLIPVSVFKTIYLETDRYEAESELLIKAVWNGLKIEYCPISLHYGNNTSHMRRFQDTIRFCRLILRLLKER